MASPPDILTFAGQAAPASTPIRWIDIRSSASRRSWEGDIEDLKQLLSGVVRCRQDRGHTVRKGSRVQLVPSLVNDNMAAGLDRLDDAFEEASDGLREGVRIRAEGIFEELHVGSQVRPGSVEAENSESPTPLHHDVILSILGSLRRDDSGPRPDLARDRGAANFLAFED